MRIRMLVSGIGRPGDEFDVTDDLGEKLVGNGKAEYVSGDSIPVTVPEQEDVGYSVDVNDHETSEEED